MAVANSSRSASNETGVGGATPPTARFGCAVSADERRLFLSAVAARLDALPVPPVWVETNDRGVLAARLAALNPEVLLTSWSTGPLPQGWLESSACALRYVCHLTGSVRWLVPREFIARGGVVSNWGDVPSASVAEQGLLLALAALRNLPSWPDAAEFMHDTPRRVEHLETRSLLGRRVGIHGFGRVGRALVSMVRPFGVKVSAYSVGVPRDLMIDAGVTPCASLEELFAGNDVIFECESLTPATAGAVSAAVLARMPDGTVFVNVARGGLVDEAALLREADSGRLRVAVDVLSGQPWHQAAAAFQRAGAIVSPHIGGPTFDHYHRCGDFAVQNVARFLRGEAVQARISLSDYDRST